jgi:hypothetical protein
MAETTHSYLDWQISTLMLAYDVAQPIARNDIAKLTERQQSVEKEIRDLALATIPKSYRDNPQSEFPADVVVLLTRATLRRAIAITGP